MQLGRHKARPPQINVMSFSDIAFLLIIFFIITASFVRPAGEEMQIPSGTTDTSLKAEKELTVRLQPGKIIYGPKAKVVTLEQLKGALADENLPARLEKDRTVIVDSGPAVPYEQYYRVLMAINKAGGQIALVEEPAQ